MNNQQINKKPVHEINNNGIAVELRHLSSAIKGIQETVSSYPAVIERQRIIESRQIEAEGRVADTLTSVNEMIVRLHTRMDEIRTLVIEDSRSSRDQINNAREDNRTFSVNLINTFREEQDRQTTAVLDGITTQISNLAKITEAIQTRLTTDVNILNGELNNLRNETSSWINKGKGAWWAASILWGFIQVTVVAVMVNLFTDVRDLRDWKIATEQKVIRLEENNTRRDEHTLPKVSSK